MDVHGANFTYTWKINTNTIKTWFGDKDSDNFFEGHFNNDGASDPSPNSGLILATSATGGDRRLPDPG